MSNFGNLASLEFAAETPFMDSESRHFGIEPLYDPYAPNFDPVDIARYERIATLGRFAAYGGRQATFLVDNPAVAMEIDYSQVETGLELLDGHKTVVDTMRKGYKSERIVEERIGAKDPREIVLIGGLVFFYDAGHDVFKHCLVYTKNPGHIRHRIRQDILEAGPFDRGEHHTPIEKGIVHGLEPVASSLDRGITKHLIWQNPIAPPNPA